MTYGLAIEPSEWRPLRELVGAVDRTPSGNVALRIGQENASGWEQTGYIVLTPAEAEALADVLAVAARAAEPGGL